jgi:hypothetical protein
MRTVTSHFGTQEPYLTLSTTGDQGLGSARPHADLGLAATSIDRAQVGVKEGVGGEVGAATAPLNEESDSIYSLGTVMRSPPPRSRSTRSSRRSRRGQKVGSLTKKALSQ